jgi:DNA-binding LacI/PurR family transcriptional regulator
MGEALNATNTDLDQDLVRLGPSSADFGFEAVHALLALRRPPTAIYLSTAPLSLGGHAR